MDAMRTYLLKITPHRAREVTRVVELTEEHTLHDVHRVIQREFALDDDHPYSFFLNNHAFDLAFEYGGPFVQALHNATETQLGALPLETNKRFLYIFDFGDELQHEVRVVGIGEVDTDTQYPRIIESNGDPPPQYLLQEDADFEGEEVDADGEEDDLDAIDAPGEEAEPEVAPEIAALGERFADLVYDEEGERWLINPRRSRAVGTLERMELERRLAHEILDATGGDWNLLAAISQRARFSVADWIAELPFDLSEAGCHEEAVDLAARVAEVMEDTVTLYDLPVLLARAGRVEEASRLAEKNLAEDPHDTAALLTSSEVALVMGDQETRERHLRSALRWAGTDWDVRIEASDDLMALMRADGRNNEAELLLREEKRYRHDMGNWRRKLQGLPPLTMEREGPKIGRNEPCPCGSGKKYKKCCGR